MSDVVIDNPVLNSPYEMPTEHFRFADDGITDEVVEERRPSSYFMPIPAAKRRQGKGQLAFDAEWTRDRIEENRLVNQIRARVDMWRRGGYQGVTRITRRLLEHWRDPERETRLFFCQLEAAETAIYITEVAHKFNDAWIANALQEFSEDANPGLFRIAHKMATGTGKTVVMAMLVAWQTLNKRENPQDGRFSDTFLVVTPGITIRDRLRVLYPNDVDDYYRKWDLVPGDLEGYLGHAKVVVTNFHAFLRREHLEAPSLNKRIIAPDDPDRFKESPDQMVRRVCRELGSKKNIIVINDEAHHCYQRRPEQDGESLSGDERKEAESREQKARVWVSGLRAVADKIGIKRVYDLSATPFFLRGSGYAEGTLFPWVVSDFSLIDAIESGIVKVPRVPVADDSVTGDQPTYRNLWERIKDDLPKRGRRTGEVEQEPQLPAELQGAIHSLYGHYEKFYERWKDDDDAALSGRTPPVFIVVCNNTSVSKLVFDYIAGWEKTLPDGSTVAVPGSLPIFSNVRDDGRWLSRPNTILVDSEELDSGDSLSRGFKEIAAREIEEFKSDYVRRFPGRDPDQLDDADLLREVMNTVGEPGRLGENVKCVVSVSMLTEGWDANTVTHILGVRAFGTQLLCEQVVGRALRRMNYVLNADERFDTEYAEVYGVPFAFIPASGKMPGPTPGRVPTRVRALDDRIACEIEFPHLIGYRYELGTEQLEASFTDDSSLVLSSEDVPTTTENAPIVGESSIHTLEQLKASRLQEVEFFLAKLVLEQYFRDGDGFVKPWLFPQVRAISRRWVHECVVTKDGAFLQMLLLHEKAHDAADRIYQAIVASDSGEQTLRPILRPYEPRGSTRYVDFDTTRPVYVTDPNKCHISHVVADTKSWEQKMAQVLESDDLDGVVHAYVKNQNLGFRIPYTLNGEQHTYIPDFLVRLDDGHGPDDLLTLIIEVSGEKRREKAAKVATARKLWVPAVNNHGGFGRWSFVEISDPWDATGVVQAIAEPVAESSVLEA